MDLMLNRARLGIESLTNGSGDGKLHTGTTEYGSKGRKWNQKLPRHRLVEDIVSSFTPAPGDRVELYIGCGDGLYNVCKPSTQQNNVEWKCIANNSDLFYQQLMKQTQKEDCLSALGVGKDSYRVPDMVQKNIFNRMRPKTSTIATQAKALMVELGSQTYWSGTSTTDMGSQAVPSTTDLGVQATTSVGDSGCQTTGISTATVGVQARPSVDNSGCQTTGISTATVGVQARPSVDNSGCQTTGISTATVGVQMTPTNQQRDGGQQSSCTDGHQITLQVNFSKSCVNGCTVEMTTIEADGISLKLSEGDSAIIQEIVRKAMAAKQSSNASVEKFFEDVIDDDITPRADQTGPAGFPHLVCQPPPKCGAGDLRMVGAAAAVPTRKTPINYRIQRQGPSGQKSDGDGTVRYHPELPHSKQIEKMDQYLSHTSPFRKFGYIAASHCPQTLQAVKLPVVYQHDITFKKGQNGSELLGHGGFGYVYLAKHSKYQFDVCVKEFEMESSSMHDVYNETKILMYLQSTKFVPFCLGLMESLFVPGDLSLVQECYAEGCTLEMLLRNRPAMFVKRKWIAVCYQLFWGLKMIHEKQVLLNDIKTDNILVDYKSDDIMNNIRFIDVGLATFRRSHRFFNDPTYMEQFENYAPEVRHGHHSTPASDLYAVGYMVDDISETIDIMEIDSIAQMCTEDDPKDRPSCQYVIEKLEEILENV